MMKMHRGLFLIFIFLVHIILGQNQDTMPVKSILIRVDIGAFYTKFISSDLYGINYDYQIYLRDKFATGISISFATNRISQNFQYKIKKPRLTFNEIDWKNHYDIFQHKQIKAGVDINNGILIAQLGDDDVKEKFYTRYGYGKRAKTVVSNYFYILDPGVDVSFRLFANKEGSAIYFTLKAKYRLSIGGANFGKTGDFNNFNFGADISIYGIFLAKSKHQGLGKDL